MAKAASAHEKAFEYAVIIALQDAVSDFAHVDLQENRILAVARDKYSLLSDKELVVASISAGFGIGAAAGQLRNLVSLVLSFNFWKRRLRQCRKIQRPKQRRLRQSKG